MVSNVICICHLFIYYVGENSSESGDFLIYCLIELSGAKINQTFQYTEPVLDSGLGPSVHVN